MHSEFENEDANYRKRMLIDLENAEQTVYRFIKRI